MPEQKHLSSSYETVQAEIGQTVIELCKHIRNLREKDSAIIQATAELAKTYSLEESIYLEFDEKKISKKKTKGPWFGIEP